MTGIFLKYQVEISRNPRTVQSKQCVPGPLFLCHHNLGLRLIYAMICIIDYIILRSPQEGNVSLKVKCAQQ